ncbi:MAG: Coenzyme F420 hydrogenase/dehydrogenase, beta subunit C-terminal domain [Candidatus Bathyarchaeota archaeon]|nr:MAG: Coenzyme F420 hydrogenase/dehydrogenase, beta subunit C-terminal domain [Candidatus Bathyarchaeota archaeon]
MSEKLKEEVWGLERCTGCGLCTAVCNKGVLMFDESVNRHPTTKEFTRLAGYRTIEIDPCKLCEAPCIEVCPRMFEWNPKTLGKVFSLRPKKSGSVTKDLLLCGLELGAIDRIVATDLDRWSSQPTLKFLSKPEDLRDSPLPVPLFSAGLKMINRARRTKRVAVVGPPCWAQALKKLETSTMCVLEPFRRPKYLKISYFCPGAFYPGVLSKIERELGIPLWSISTIEIAGNGSELAFQTGNGRATIPLIELARFMAKGCARCVDFVGEQADIAVGSVGSKPGFETAIIRTSFGEELVRAATKMNYIELGEPSSSTRKELRSFIESKKKRASAVETDKTLLAAIKSLKKPIVDEEALQKLEGLSQVKKKES